MTEREILKRLVEVCNEPGGSHTLFQHELMRCISDARTVLAQNGEPEHPAVEAYRKWCDSRPSRPIDPSESFLGGWKQALLHIAGTFDGQCEKHLVAAGNATPTELP